MFRRLIISGLIAFWFMYDIFVIVGFIDFWNADLGPRLQEILMYLGDQIWFRLLVLWITFTGGVFWILTAVEKSATLENKEPPPPLEPPM